MPRIKTDEFQNRISRGDFRAVRLTGSQGGAFYMMLEVTDSTYILENANGSIKEYPKADHALAWLKRKTSLKEVIVNIEIWRSDA